MIKAIIFDFGSVLVKTDWEKANEDFTKKEGFSIFFRGNKELEELYTKVNTGKERLKTLMSKIALKDSNLDRTIESYKEFYLKHRTMNKELFSLIKELKKKYTLYCYTDTIQEHFEANFEKGFFSDFEKVFTSFELGKNKQHSDSFHELLKLILFKAEECLFIDDHPKNIENAKATGFNVIHYTDFPDLRQIEEGFNNLGVVV